MKYNKNRHIELVILSQNLENQGKDILIENPKESLELCEYNVTIEEHVYWIHRENFVLIMKNFLANILNFEEFETAFSLLFEEVRKKVDMFIIDLEQIEKFQPSTRLYQFALVLSSIYRQFEEVEDEYCTEQELKHYVKEAYLEFQKFEEFYRISQDAGLIRAAEEACKNVSMQKGLNHLEEQLTKRNKNPGIGRKTIYKDVIEHRDKNGGRLYVLESKNVIEIVAKSGKKKSNQQFVINRLKELYN